MLSNHYVAIRQELNADDAAAAKDGKPNRVVPITVRQVILITS